MWGEMVARLTKGNDYVKLNPPAINEDILRVESELVIEIPSDLKKMLLEFNGDNYFLFSTVQILETNLAMREITCYMPLDCLLFFAGNGCGDYYGYAISKEGIREGEVYMWEHETDNRVCKATGLKDVIERYYTDRI